MMKNQHPLMDSDNLIVDFYCQTEGRRIAYLE
jgi:hypothetical protein